MRVFVYLDESGSIHKNSKTKYFAVGGYFAVEQDKNKITSIYKRINKVIKEEKNIDLKKELKSYDLSVQEKTTIFKSVQDIDSFCGCSMIFEKAAMKKEILKANIFFNYAVKLLFEDCIMPLLEEKKVEFVVSVDNRNIRVGDLKDLQTYLKTEFCLYDYDFQVTYYDSSTNFGIQLADLIVNTFYNSYKDIKIVKDVMPHLKAKNFRTSLFPGYNIRGRRAKLVDC